MTVDHDSYTDCRAGLGPAVGAVIAVVFYRFIKILEYEVANPGQDAKDETEEKTEAEEKVLPRHRRSESQA